MKKSEAQLTIYTHISRKVPCQNFLVCAMADIFGMRNGRKLWYAQVHVNLVCAGAGQFGMRLLLTRKINR